MTKRACKSTTKAGKPCKAAPLKERDYCAAHDPDQPASTRFGAPEQARAAGHLGGRPRMPRPSDLARDLVEQHVTVILRPYFRALGYDVTVGPDGLQLVHEGGGAKLVHRGFRMGEGSFIEESDIDDLGAQMAAAERLLDRIYGKPRQAVEHTGAGGGPIETSSLDTSKLTTDELRALAGMLRRAQPDTDPQADAA